MMSYSGTRQATDTHYVRDHKKRKVPWWQRTVIYQVYPRSFRDSRGHGTGDLKGIIDKADYFSELGVGTIWISPIYTSPMADFGYDVSNFRDIDPIFGTLQDFDKLIKEMHARDIRVVMDLIPNHTSDEHEWFQRSCQEEPPYTDYYIWRPAKEIDESGEPVPPNNWLSVFGGSAWKWSDERNEYYLHQFLEKQPDLNYRNPRVVMEMENIIKFWLDRGVDGFRVDAVKHLFETEDMSEDEPIAEDSGVHDPHQYEYLNHTLTVNRPEIFDVLKGWRKVLDEYSDRLLVAEVYGDVQEVMQYYGESQVDYLADFPFNFYLITEIPSRLHFSGTSLKLTIDLWMDNMTDGKWPNWVLGNHDNGRVASRLGEDLVDALHMVTFLLPGTPITYYGEELGMTDTYVSYEDTQDPFGSKFGPERYHEFSRDTSRTPMQWNNKRFAGFTEGGHTWLPVNPNYTEVNVKSQKDAQQSHLKIYKELVQLRQEPAFTKGSLLFPVVNTEIFSFLRCYGESSRYLIVINTSTDSVKTNITKYSTVKLPETGEIVLRSSDDVRLETNFGNELNLNSVTLAGGGGLVILLREDEESTTEEEN